MSDEFSNELFSGLRVLAESSFPKICPSCGKRFDTADQFIAETNALRTGQSGLKQAFDDDDKSIVEAFRNCVCGSTLMDFFSDRRDLTAEGLGRRKKFGELLEFLAENGLDKETARRELLKVVHGGTSEILMKYRPPK